MGLTHDNFDEIRVKLVKAVRFMLNGTEVTATAAEINKLAGSTLTAAEMTALHGVTKTAAQINALLQSAIEVDFTETDIAGVYTGAVVLPAGAIVQDVLFASTAVWTNGTAATMKCGDAGDDDGIFTAVNVKTTPAANVALSYQRKDVSVGAYAGTKQLVYPAGGTITFTVTTTGAAGSAGRSKGIVLFVVPVASAATKA